MRIPIFTKLFISLFITSILLVISMTFLVSYSFKSGFQGYLNQQEKVQVAHFTAALADYYLDHNDWKGLVSQPVIWGKLIGDPMFPFPVRQGERLADLSQSFPFNQGLNRLELNRLHDVSQIKQEFLPISHRIHLEDEQHRWLIGLVPRVEHPAEIEWLREPIVVDGKTVGWLALQQKHLLSGPLVSQFYAQQQSNLYWIIGLAGFVSLIVALCLVRIFLSPLKHLKQGATALSEGRYDFAFRNSSNDEFGELSVSFQYLVDSLKQQKENREQWLVDISHELRTPIAVLRSELEAIQDGIRQPEMKRMDSMHHQVIGLGGLVDDLYLLSKTDSGEYQMEAKTLEIAQLVQRVVMKFEHRAQQRGLNIEFIKPEAALFITGDEKTLEQLCMNLLENSLRYTDAPGRVVISITEAEKDVVLRCEDSSPNVDAEHLPNLFKRLYRVDQSRSRQHGGSGLGLSICRNIIMMHGGTAVAMDSAIGGLAIEIRLKKLELES